jgi:aspartate/methionine/tyrosine aminotransferase
MEIRPTGAPVSTIIEIGNRARKMQEITGNPHLLLHAGVNNVTQLDVNPIAAEINFNQAFLQHYPGSAGRLEFRQAINNHYFGGKADVANILITAGGTNGLYVSLKTLNISHVMTPKFFWGTYKMLSITNRLQHCVYHDFDDLLKKAPTLNHTAVIISDPGNPLGDKIDDALLLEVINKLDSLGVPVIFDAPYRYLFTDQNDGFYRRLISFENVIINESFSKSIGLSGYRIGFMHNPNSTFVREASKNILYCSNGVNVVGQEIVRLLLATAKGTEIVSSYKQTTVEHITKNIAWLKAHKLLALELYEKGNPIGIYAVINVKATELEQYKIFGVPLSYFTTDATGQEHLTRICVSVNHSEFVSYFAPLSKQKK